MEICRERENNLLKKCNHELTWCTCHSSSSLLTFVSTALVPRMHSASRGVFWILHNFRMRGREKLRCWRLSAPLNSRRKENKFSHNSPSKCTYSLTRCNKICRFLLLFVKLECFCTWYTIVVCSSIESLSLNVVIMFKAKVSLTWEKNRLFSFVGVEKSIVLWGGYLWAAAIHG